jgi:hypothetical protein
MSVHDWILVADVTSLIIGLPAIITGLIILLNWWNDPIRQIRRDNHDIAREDASIRRENKRILRGE